MEKMSSMFASNITPEEIRTLPRSGFSGEIIVVDDPRSVPEAVEMMGRYDVMGFDTETKPAFRKGVFNSISLLQFAVSDKAFLFRLNRTGLPQQLADILSSHRVTKAGVAIKDDIAGLQQIELFDPAGFVELQDYVNQFGIESNGLRKLAAIVLGIHISKKEQISNWESETLTDSQLHYAATDAWVCYEIYTRLERFNGEGEKQ